MVSRSPAPTLVGCLLAPTLAAGLLAAPASAQLVTGQVLEEGTRAPIASAMVHLLDADGTRVTSMPTDGAGRFALQVPEPGAWRVEVMRPGYVSAEPEAFEVEAGGVAVLPPLELAADEEALENLPVPPRTIVGRVVADGFDEPMPGVLVRALDAMNDGVAAAVSDASGRFRLTVPEAGEYQVEASRLAGEQQIRERVEVGEAAGARVRLELPHESVQPGEDYYHRQTDLTRGRAQFTERREQGLGYFYDRETILSMDDVTRPSHVFFDVPGLDVEYPPCAGSGATLFPDSRPMECTTSERATVRSFQGWQCMVVFHDHQFRPVAASDRGELFSAGIATPGEEPPRLAGTTIDYFDLDEIEGIEIYRSYREVPQELRQSLIGPLIWPPNHLGGCGVAIIWTRSSW